MYKICCFDKL